MAKYVLLVATSASCFRNFQRGLGDFLLSGGEGQKQIQWGGYICEEEWGEKVKFERVSNWGKMVSFFELSGSIFNYKWYQRAHAKTGDETVVSQRRKLMKMRKEGTKRTMLTNKTFDEMKEQTNPSIRWYQGVESWAMRWEKNQLSINLKLSLEMNQSQKVGKQKCPVQHRLRWVQFKIFLAFIIQVLTFLQDLGFHHPYFQLLTRLTGISKSIDSIWGGKLKVVPARIRTRTDA